MTKNPSTPLGVDTRNGLTRLTAAPQEAGTAVGKVVHLVGFVNEDVFSFLGPASSALAEAQVEQTIVFVSSPQLHDVLPRLHASVRVVQTPPTRNPVRRWLWAFKAFRKELSDRPAQAVHLYGQLPRLIGTWVARREGIAIALHHAPYRSTTPVRGGNLEHLLHGLTPQPSTKPAEPSSIDLAERPVDVAFFSAVRNEARHPLLVTGSHVSNPRSADLFAQLAVLLGGEDLGLAFNWVGSVDTATRMRLKAAKVGVFAVDTVEDWAARLAAGWVYLAPGGDPGFPALLVEAMAVGLPCVAVDTPNHRDVIRHGETGYLCRTAEEIVNCIAPLIDSRELRARIGQAARLDIAKRFDEKKFRDALLAAYQLPQKNAAPPHMPA